MEAGRKRSEPVGDFILRSFHVGDANQFNNLNGVVTLAEVIGRIRLLLDCRQNQATQQLTERGYPFG
jgi:hypothetical protein